MPQNSNSLKPLVPMLPFPQQEEDIAPPPPLPAYTPIDNSDLMSQINALLQPASSPTPQHTGFGGVLRNLLAALPQAISVGLSKDPGEALTNQLRETRAMNFQREQYERQRRDRLEDLRRQVGVDVLRGDIEQRREVARENRRYQQQVGLTQQEQAFRKGERQAEAESRYQLADLEQKGREALQASGFKNAVELSNMNFQNDVQLKSTELAMKYAALGMDGGVAYDIAKRSLSGKLTAADNKVISEVYGREYGQLQQERALGRKLTQAQINELNAKAAHERAAAAAARGKGGGLASEMQKVFFRGLEDAIKTPMVQLANGTVTERSGLSIIDQANVVKTLSQEENIARFMKGPGAMLLQGVAQGHSQETTLTGSEKAAVATSLDQQIKNFRKLKTPDDKIVEGLIEWGKASGRMQDVTDTIIRNGLESAGKKYMEAGIREATSGAKVNQLPKEKTPVKVNSVVPGQGPLSQGLRWIEQKMAELGQYMEDQSQPNPPPGFDPRTRRPIGENPVQFPMSEPKPLGLLPPFRPEVVTQPLARGNASIEDAFGRLRVPNEYAEYGNPGNIGRGIESLVSKAGNAQLPSISMEPTGNFTIDVLLERLGLIPPGSAAQAQARR